jgi:hypothetical protein
MNKKEQRINELVIKHLKMPRDDGNPINNPMGGCGRYYSTDIVDAWMVVEKIKEKHSVFSLSWSEAVSVGGEKTDGWICSIDKIPLAGHASAPMAICLAALKAKGVEV